MILNYVTDENICTEGCQSKRLFFLLNNPNEILLSSENACIVQKDFVPLSQKYKELWIYLIICLQSSFLEKENSKLLRVAKLIRYSWVISLSSSFSAAQRNDY